MKKTKFAHITTLVLLVVLILSITTLQVLAEEYSGGWKESLTSKETSLPSPVKNAFSKATSELTGVQAKPLALLGSQVVNGMNYCILTHVKTLSQDPSKHLALFYLWVDSSGKAQITSTKDLSLSGEGNSSGAWKLASSAKKCKLSASNKKIFKKAAKKYKDLPLKAIAHLGTQVVSGTNHLYLASGGSSSKALYLVFLYEPLSGKPSIVQAQRVNVAGNA